MVENNTNVAISGSGLYVPPNPVDNKSIVQSFNAYASAYNKWHERAIADGTCEPKLLSDLDFIVKASGIKNRYLIDKDGVLDPKRMKPHIEERPDEELSVQAEMAMYAARNALESADLSEDDVDCIIVACSNFQRSYPAISIELQKHMGMTGMAFDMNVACSSSIFALNVAYGLVKGGSSKTVLVVSPEICSAHCNFKDRNSHFIFGDAATAFVVQAESAVAVKNYYNVENIHCQTEFSNNIRNNFGFLAKLNPESFDTDDNLFKQDGRRVFKEVTIAVSAMIKQQLEQANLSAKEIKKFWLHQANRHMNELILKNLTGERVNEKLAPSILEEYGNTATAGAMIAFHQNHTDLGPGELGLLSCFGAGYSMGSAILSRQCHE